MMRRIVMLMGTLCFLNQATTTIRAEDSSSVLRPENHDLSSLQLDEGAPCPGYLPEGIERALELTDLRLISPEKLAQIPGYLGHTEANLHCSDPIIYMAEILDRVVAFQTKDRGIKYYKMGVYSDVEKEITDAIIHLMYMDSAPMVVFSGDVAKKVHPALVEQSHILPLEAEIDATFFNRAVIRREQVSAQVERRVYEENNHWEEGVFDDYGQLVVGTRFHRHEFGRVYFIGKFNQSKLVT